MAGRYASARTYVDRGAVVRGAHLGKFRTHFQRHLGYRFDWPMGSIRSGKRPPKWEIDAIRFSLGSVWVASLLTKPGASNWFSRPILGNGLRLISRDRHSEIVVRLDSGSLLVREISIDHGYGRKRALREACELDAHLRAIPSIPAELRHRCRPRDYGDAGLTVIVFEPEMNGPVDPGVFA